MRYHFWQFLINQEGQPINDADISVYAAGTTTPVVVYLGELSSETANVAPQVKTNSNGFFEFWIGDEEEAIGYTRGTKFKISWNRTGIASGTIDNIEVFQTTEGVDETDADSTFKNKLISNALAYQFDTHSKHDVLDDGYPIHGLMMVDTNSTENVFNKVISNKLANEWEIHKNYEFDSFSPSVLDNSAHNLQPINYNSTDSKFNKLMADNILYDLKASIDLLGAYTETIEVTGWVLNGGSGNYEYNIIHNLDWDFPAIDCWDIDSRMVYAPTNIYSEDANIIKIENQTPQRLKVGISRR